MVVSCGFSGIFLFSSRDFLLVKSFDVTEGDGFM